MDERENVCPICHHLQRKLSPGIDFQRLKLQDSGSLKV